MTCKDCIHYEACKSIVEATLMDVVIGEAYNAAESCPNFADKSLYIKLPCKVGDTVYVDGDTWGHSPLYFAKMFIYSKYFVVGEVVSIIKTKKQLLMKIRASNSIHTRYSHERYTVNAIGKTVFLTREEAEAALEGRK